MSRFYVIVCLFLGFALTGCYDLHGYVPPVITMGDAGVVLGDADMTLAPDAFVPPDSGTVEPDAGAGAAEIIVDRLFDEPSQTYRTGAGRVIVLTLLALNDGSADGTIDQIVFDTRARIVPASPEAPWFYASIRDAVGGCYLLHEGEVVATGRFEGEQLLFDDVGLVVTTAHRGWTHDEFVRFELACDEQLSPTAISGDAALRFWFGVDWMTGLTLVEGPPSRIEGTLQLAQNTDDRATMTHWVQFVR